jgi:hypothetical protein
VTPAKSGTEGIPRRLGREVKVHTMAYRALRSARRAARGKTVVVGPWSSEVGFELLYWIPFVRRLLRRSGIPPERVVAVSRGGVSGWYGDLATRYLDLLDWLSPDELMAERAHRIETGGGEKQMAITPFDRRALAEVAERIGESNLSVLHPSTMYRRYRSVWMRRRAPTLVTREVDFEPIRTPASPLDGLPSGEYIAVKAYFSSTFPDNPENHEALHTLLERLTRHAPVVLLNSGAALDDHELPELSDIELVSPPPGAWDPRTNLAVQTRILRGARLLVATYGGFSYLGPFLGIPTCAFYAEPNFNRIHLEILRAAESALRKSEAGSTPPGGFLPFNTHHLPLIDQLAGAATAGAGAFGPGAEDLA